MNAGGPWRHKGRWWLKGRLETRGLLHVGSGETVTRPELVDERTRKPAQVSAVAVGAAGRPYVPGSTLKGVLAGWAADHAGSELVEAVFGSEDRGGGLVFADAPLAGDPEPEAPPPYWHRGRRTGVVPRVAIDRRFGTASHRRLFYLEVVPAGAELTVEVGGDGVTREEMALALAALEAFNGDLALGAHTGDGWGRMRWHLEELRHMGSAEVVEWLEDGAQRPPAEAAAPLSDEALARLLERAREIAALAPAGAARAGVDVELRFDGPFLVRDTDPARAGKGIERPDAVARRDRHGRPHLPASSFRGALRSRAEMILRTLGGDGAACGIDAPREPCRAVESLPEVRRLCPACRVYGAAGWRAPLRITDFDAGEDGTPLRQHFVAIDRFTGGAARERKFDVEGVLEPRLTGRLEVDLEALDRAGSGAWAFGLLVLVLRDLVEGDVTFGANAVRGYGACRAVVGLPSLPAWEAVPEGLRNALGVAPHVLAGPLAWPESSSPLGEALAAWVRELKTVATAADRAWRESREERS
jgi:CRISPR/Cas system CSM-associated protein Csm3 (group 7 of RAMP superfamily)